MCGGAGPEPPAAARCLSFVRFGLGMLAAVAASACAKPAKPPPESFPRPSADLDGGLFSVRGPRSGDERTLTLVSFAVEITSSRSTFRTHAIIDMQTSAPGLSWVAVLRLAVPPGAALTRAVLWIDDRPQEGRFVPRERTGRVRSYGEENIEILPPLPMVVGWDGPEWIAVSVYPLEAGRPRRVELEWVEPAATRDDDRVYRLPIIGHKGALVGRPSRVSVDGRAVSTEGRDWLRLPGGSPALATARALADPDSSLALLGATRRDPLRVVFVAETSATMGDGVRQTQRELIDAALASLPADARVTLMAADWTTVPIIQDAAPAQARHALSRLDGRLSAGRLDLEHALGEVADQAAAMHAAVIVWIGPAEFFFGAPTLKAELARLRESRTALLVAEPVGGKRELIDAALLSGGAVPGTTAALVRALGDPRWTSRPVPPGESDLAGNWLPLPTVTGEVRWIGLLRGDRAPASSVSLAGDLDALAARARLDPNWPVPAGRPPTQPALGPLVALVVGDIDDPPPLRPRTGLPILGAEASARPDATAGASSRSPWARALDAFRQDATRSGRVARVAELVGQPALTDPHALGWWLVGKVRREIILPVEARTLACELLIAAGSAEDARRILTEHDEAPGEIAAEFRRWGATEEAARLVKVSGETHR
jgi:hypothetical protein